jgi:hypothetical protein
MRDVDAEFRTVLAVRRGEALGELSDLAGRRRKAANRQRSRHRGWSAAAAAMRVTSSCSSAAATERRSLVDVAVA